MLRNIFHPRWFIIVLLLIELCIAVEVLLNPGKIINATVLVDMQRAYFFLNNVVISHEIPQWLPHVNQGVPVDLSMLLKMPMMQGVYFIAAPLVKAFNFIDLYMIAIVVDHLMLVVGCWCWSMYLLKHLWARYCVTLTVLLVSLNCFQLANVFHCYAALPLVLYFLYQCLGRKPILKVLLGGISLIVIVSFSVIPFVHQSYKTKNQGTALVRADFNFKENLFQMRRGVNQELNNKEGYLGALSTPVWQSRIADKVMMFSHIARCPDEDTVRFFLMHGDYRGYFPFMIDPNARMAESCLNNLTADYRMNAYLDIFRFSANHVVLSVNSNSDGWLTYADYWHPNWVARVDSKAVPVTQANLFYKSIPVSKGIHVVEFNFEHRWQMIAQWGLAYSALLCLLLLIGIIFKLLRD